METLEELRKKIDSLDAEIVRLLNERCRTVQKVGAFKKGTAGAIYVPERERLVYEKVRKLNEGPMSHVTLFAVYREIMSGSFALEQGLKIACFGPEGAYTHLAAISKFGNSVVYQQENSASLVLENIASGKCDYGCLPEAVFLEEVLPDLLPHFSSGKISICAEIYGNHLFSPSGRPGSRFFVIGRQTPGKTGEDNTSVVFSLPDRPGALCDALLPFKDEEISLHIAGSAPGKKGEYCFFADIPGHDTDEKVRRVIGKLRGTASSLVLLGSYPRGIESFMEKE